MALLIFTGAFLYVSAIVTMLWKLDGFTPPHFFDD